MRVCDDANVFAMKTMERDRKMFNYYLNDKIIVTISTTIIN